MLVTALSSVIGYDKASKIAHCAMDNDLTPKAATLKLGYVTAALGWDARAVVVRLSRMRARAQRAQLNRRTETRHRLALVWSLPSSDSELIGLREIPRKPKSLP
jgi:hypothetical protein